MNDLQKKLFIVGITAFIFWTFLAISNNAFSWLFDGHTAWFVEKGIYNTNSAGCGVRDMSKNCATWIHTLTFITWTGSLIAFFVYKD